MLDKTSYVIKKLCEVSNHKWQIINTIIDLSKKYRQEEAQECLISLLSTAEFHSFFVKYKDRSAVRFESLCDALFSTVLSCKADPVSVRRLIDYSTSESFRKVSDRMNFFNLSDGDQTYVDRELLRIYLNNSGGAEQLSLVLLSEEFSHFKAKFSQNESETVKLILKTILSNWDAGVGVVEISTFLSIIDMSVTNELIEYLKEAQLYTTSDIICLIFSICIELDNTEYLIQIVKKIGNRKFIKKLRNSNSSSLIIQLIKLACDVSSKEELTTFLSFIDILYRQSESFVLLCSTCYLNLHYSKRHDFLFIIVSDKFSRFLQNYDGYDEIQNLLCDLFFFCLLAEECKFIPSIDNIEMVHNIILNSDIPMMDLKRRADFYKWLLKKDLSEQMRIKFFSYLVMDLTYFMLLENCKSTNLSSVPRYFTSGHRRYIDLIDANKLPTGELLLSEYNKEKLFETVYMNLLKTVWEENIDIRFIEKNCFDEIRNIAEYLCMTDYVLNSIKQLSPQDINEYCESVKSAAVSAQDGLDDLIDSFQPFFYKRLYLSTAEKKVREVIISLLGNASVQEAETAKTDGETIFLPKYICYFPDAPENMDKNRNLSMYIYLALHECGHIIGGSFEPNISGLLNTLKKPELFRNIYNFIEDYRIEEFLKKQNVHYQVEDIIDKSRKYLFNSIPNASTAILFFGYIMDDIYNDTNRYKTDEKWRNEIESFLQSCTECCLPYLNVRIFLDYIIIKMKGMNIYNPFESFLLSRNIYDVLQRWESFDELLENESSMDAMFPMQSTSEFDGVSGRNIFIRSWEELQRLYEDADLHPEKYIEDRFLPEEIGDPEIEPVPVPDIIDAMTYTAADKMIGEQQKKGLVRKRTVKKVKKGIKNISRKGSNRILIPQESGPGYESCRLIEIRHSNEDFLARHHKYCSIERKLRLQLLEMLPKTDYAGSELSLFDGDIDMERVINLMIDYDNSQDFRFLENNPPGRQSFHAVIGLDISGSTCISFDNSRIIDIEKHFALLFYDALYALGGKVEVFAFNSLTGTNIYKAISRNAISAFEADQCNRDGDFIKYIDSYLGNSEAPQKYFFFISDGQPSSINYSGQPAIEDTVKAMENCRDKGVNLFYINIDPGDAGYFGDFAAAASSAVRCESPQELPRIVPELVGRVMRG